MEGHEGSSTTFHKKENANMHFDKVLVTERLKRKDRSIMVYV